MTEQPQPESSEEPTAPAPPSPEEIQANTTKLNNQNQSMLDWINSKPDVNTFGLESVRHEYLYECMVEAGLLPPNFVLFFENRWAGRLNGILKGMVQDINKRDADIERERLRQTLLQGVPLKGGMPHG